MWLARRSLLALLALYASLSMGQEQEPSSLPGGWEAWAVCCRCACPRPKAFRALPAGPAACAMQISSPARLARHTYPSRPAAAAAARLPSDDHAAVPSLPLNLQPPLRYRRLA